MARVDPHHGPQISRMEEHLVPRQPNQLVQRNTTPHRLPAVWMTSNPSQMGVRMSLCPMRRNRTHYSAEKSRMWVRPWMP